MGQIKPQPIRFCLKILFSAIVFDVEILSDRNIEVKIKIISNVHHIMQKPIVN